MRRLAAVAVVLLVACGVKNRPLPPELVQPEPPTEIVGRSQPDGVRLTWTRPTTDSGGRHMRDLGGFNIDRATGADGIDFARVGRVTLTDQDRFRQERTISWTDTSVVTGTTYRYRVTAFTLDGYRSVPGGPLTIEHTPGASAQAPPPATPAPVKKRPKRPPS